MNNTAETQVETPPAKPVELPRYRTAARLLPTDDLENTPENAGGIDIYLVFVCPG